MALSRCLICSCEVLTSKNRSHPPPAAGNHTQPVVNGTGKTDNGTKRVLRSASKSPTKSVSPSLPPTPPPRGIDELISSQLRVIFILKELLCIPSESLIHYLGISQGESPESWLHFCENCDKEMEKARGLFEQIVDASKKFKLIQAEIVSKLKQSFENTSDTTVTACTVDRTNPSQEGDGRRTEAGLRIAEIANLVTEETREFVKRNEYFGFHDPFIPGDLAAKEKLKSRPVPVVSPQAPATSSPGPITSSQAPATSSQAPATSSPGPTTSSQAPVTLPQAPATSSPAPAASSQAPATSSQESTDDPDWEADEDDDDDTEEVPVVTKKYSRKPNKNRPRQKYIKTSSIKIFKDSTELLKDALKPVAPQGHWVTKPKSDLWKVEKEAILEDQGRGLFQCLFEDCRKVFVAKRSYLYHKLTHYGERVKHYCDQCGAKFGSYSGVYTHKRVVHQNKPRSIKTYVVNKEKTKRQCPHCDKVINKFNLKTHIQLVHEKSLVVECPICGRKLSGTEKRLKSHLSEIHYYCSVNECNERFQNREQMYVHQVEKHGKGIDVLSCETCGKILTAHSMKYHRKTHQNLPPKGPPTPDPQECKVCGKIMKHKTSLNRHMREVHNPKKGDKSTTGSAEEVEQGNALEEGLELEGSALVDMLLV